MNQSTISWGQRRGEGGAAGPPRAQPRPPGPQAARGRAPEQAWAVGCGRAAPQPRRSVGRAFPQTRTLAQGGASVSRPAHGLLSPAAPDSIGQSPRALETNDEWALGKCQRKRD